MRILLLYVLYFYLFCALVVVRLFIYKQCFLGFRLHIYHNEIKIGLEQFSFSLLLYDDNQVQTHLTITDEEY